MFKDKETLSDTIEKIKHTLPLDFDYIKYLEYNPDLSANGINTEELAEYHYLLFGINEQRVYKQISLIDTIDNNFDPEFYLSEYPDVQSYYRFVNGISEKEKLFHHYIHYGKNEGRFKNKTEQDRSLIDTKNYITTIIDHKDLINPSNKLECICLMTTLKEINNGKLNNFIKQIAFKTKKSKISSTLNFKIVVNNFVNPPDVSLIKNLFNSVEIINLQLTKKEDIYLSDISKTKKLPYYGLKSGPNITFFKSIELCNKYNTTLFLETDCILHDNWLKKIYLYTKHSNGFLIAGATYDGVVFAKAGSAMMNHINGGIALYATNNNILQKIITLLSKFLHEQIHYNSPGLAYDYAFKILIDHNLNNYLLPNETREIWKFINRNYVATKLIINCSTKADVSLDTKTLIEKYDFALLHKKTSNV